MKNKIYIALYMGLLFVCNSCYKDEGNYDYHALPKIEIKVDHEIYAKQFEELKLVPDVDFGGDRSDNYDFTWRIWPNGVLGTSNQKEISKEKELHYIVTEAPGAYILALTCHNKETGVNTYKEVSLAVHGVITEGWMVLQAKEGKTDFSMIMSPYFSKRVAKDQVIDNMYKSVNGEELEGRGAKIGSYFALGRYQYVTILTDKGGVRLDATTMQKTYDIPTLMLDKKPLKPQNYYYINYRYSLGKGFEVIVSDGRFYENSLLGKGYTEPVSRNGESYKASPYGAKWIWTFAGILYDELKGRFLAIDRYQNLGPLPDATGRKFDWNNLHGTLRYMDTGFKHYEYALIQDWDTKKSKLYVMNFDVKKNFDIAVYDAANCPEIENASLFALGDRGNVFFFADAKNIYQYDYAGTNTSKKIYSLENSPERLTGMKIFKPCVDKFISNHPYNNKILVLSTYNDSSKEGKIYMYNINESNGDLDRATEKVFSGFGEILDREYNYPKYGS